MLFVIKNSLYNLRAFPLSRGYFTPEQWIFVLYFVLSLQLFVTHTSNIEVQSDECLDIAVKLLLSQ